MKVFIDRSFEKDISEIRNQGLLARVAAIIELTEGCNSLTDIPNLKKLKGNNDCFRIRVGDFRIGLRVKANEIKFIRFLNRKDIYKYFP
jgi:mRNA interferase RelE/StbE